MLILIISQGDWNILNLYAGNHFSSSSSYTTSSMHAIV